MPVLGSVDGTGPMVLKLRRILFEWSRGEGWGQVRKSDLLEEWDESADAFEEALAALESEGEVELVEIGDVVSVQPADGPAQNQAATEAFTHRLRRQRSH